MVKGRRQQVKQIKEHNRKVIIFLKKTVFFLRKKNSAVRKKFEEIIIFYQELGDQKIKKYFIGSSSRSHYMPTVSVDEFLKLINDHLEQELLNDIMSAENFSLLADKTTDMANRAVLSVYIRYLHSVNNQVKEVYLELVEIQDSKGAEALVKKFAKFFVLKVLT